MGRANNHRPRGGKEPPKRKNAKNREATQAGGGLVLTAQQLLLPMIEGMARSKQALLEWVQQVGLSALGELFERDAEQLAGPKGKHSKERSHYRWGSAPAELPLGTEHRGRRGAAAHGRALPAHRSGARASAQSDPARRLDPRL